MARRPGREGGGAGHRLLLRSSPGKRTDTETVQAARAAGSGDVRARRSEGMLRPAPPQSGARRPRTLPAGRSTPAPYLYTRPLPGRGGGWNQNVPCVGTAQEHTAHGGPRSIGLRPEVAAATGGSLGSLGPSRTAPHRARRQPPRGWARSAAGLAWKRSQQTGEGRGHRHGSTLLGLLGLLGTAGWGYEAWRRPMRQQRQPTGRGDGVEG